MAKIFVGQLFGTIVAKADSFNGELFFQEIFNEHNFSGVDFTKTIFVSCVFNNCNFSNADISGTYFIDCTLNNEPLTHSGLVALGGRNVKAGTYCLGKKIASLASFPNDEKRANNWSTCADLEQNVVTRNGGTNVNFKQKIISLEQALSVWEAFQSSFLYCNLMTGKTSTIPETSEEGKRKNELNLNALLIENEQCTWYIHKELEDDFKNNREIYCFVIGLSYMVDKLYPGFSVIPEQIVAVIARHLYKHNTKNFEHFNTLDNVERIMNEFTDSFYNTNVS